MASFSFIQPPGVHLAGGGAYISPLIAALRTAGHDVDVLTSPPSPQPGRITVIDGLALPAFTPDAADGAIGLVHHTTALADGDAKADIRSRERILLPRLRLVVATSEAMGATLRENFGVLPDRLVVIPPGAPDVPRSTGSGGPGCAILSVGALVPRKGHAILLQAVAKLFDLNWSLTIVGDDTRDPAHAASLRAQAAADGIADRVTFTGALDDMTPAWEAADLFALATRWEGYPATIARALRYGLPLAITEAGAAAGMAAPEYSVVAPVDDAVQLSKAMRRIIFDPALRADMAAAAWQAGQALPDWAARARQFVEATG